MSIFEDFKDLFKSKEELQADLGEMTKTDYDADKLPEKVEDIVETEGSIGRKAIIDDPYFDFSQNHFIYKSKQSRIAHRTLKDVSLRDWLVSSVIQSRTDTMMRFSRPQMKPQKLEMGYKIIKKNGEWDLTEREHEEVAMLEDFVYHCGRKKNVAKSDEMSFSTFIKMTTRDALTFGHIAIEKIMTRGGAFHRFRPVPAESTYRVHSNTSRDIIKKEVENARKAYEVARRDANDPKLKQKTFDKPVEYYRYVQMSHDNKVLAAFGDEDMLFRLFNPQNFSDSLGYCYLPGTSYVLKADGTVSHIENLEENDMIISHKGVPQRVYETKSRHFDGNVISITPLGMTKQVVTDNHPLLAIKEGKTAKDFVRFQKHKKIEWLQAKDINVGDYMVVPRLQYNETFNEIDFLQYGIEKENRVYSSVRGRKSLPLKVPMTDNIAWLLGLYLGNGCVINNKSVRIDLSLHETYLLDRISLACH